MRFIEGMSLFVCRMMCIFEAVICPVRKRNHTRESDCLRVADSTAACWATLSVNVNSFAFTRSSLRFIQFAHDLRVNFLDWLWLYGWTRERIACLLLLKLSLAKKVLKFYFSRCWGWYFFLFFWSWDILFRGIWATEIDVGDFITDFLVWRQNPICFLPSISNWVFFLGCSPTIKQDGTNMWTGFSKSSHAVAVGRLNSITVIVSHCITLYHYSGITFRLLKSLKLFF